MADYGLKIAKAGKNTDSTTIGDYAFWSKYPPLTFLEKKTFAINITSGGYAGTSTVEHDYSFFPLVLGYVSKTSGNPTDYNNQKYLMPASQFAGIECDMFYDQEISFTYKILDDSVEVTFEVSCVPWGGGSAEAPTSNSTFTIDLYFFMWEMGS